MVVFGMKICFSVQKERKNLVVRMIYRFLKMVKLFGIGFIFVSIPVNLLFQVGEPNGSKTKLIEGRIVPRVPWIKYGKIIGNG